MRYRTIGLSTWRLLVLLIPVWTHARYSFMEMCDLEEGLAGFSLVKSKAACYGILIVHYWELSLQTRLPTQYLLADKANKSVLSYSECILLLKNIRNALLDQKNLISILCKSARNLHTLWSTENWTTLQHTKLSSDSSSCFQVFRSNDVDAVVHLCLQRERDGRKSGLLIEASAGRERRR